MFYKLQSLNWQLFISPLLLCTIGLISIYSITNANDINEIFLKKQIIFLFIGVAINLFISLYRIDYEKIALPLYIGSIFFLILVILQGSAIKGTTAWFQLAGMSIEPVEFIKFILLIDIATIINKYGNMRKSNSFIASILVLLPPFILILSGKEFGTIAITTLAAFVMLLVYNLNFKFIATTFIIFFITSLTLWLFILNDTQKARFRNFLNPQEDIKGADYQAYQSKLAIGSGGFFGQPNESKVNLLPESHNDFIFALTAQKWGFFGISILLSIIFNFIIQILLNLKEHKLPTFQLLTIIGFTTIFFTQFFINIAMNLGLLPITGITLPFVSYGGSSLFSSFLAIGIIQNFFCQAKEKARVMSK